MIEPAVWACCAEYLVFQLSGAFAIAYTSPSDTLLRAAASLCVILISTHLQWGLKPAHCSSGTEHFIKNVGMLSIFQTFHMVELLLLSRASYVDEIQQRKKRESDNDDGGNDSRPTFGTLLRPILWSWRVVWNPRQIGTRWQVKNIPRFHPASANGIYSRFLFVRTQLTMFGSIVAGLYALKMYVAKSDGLSTWFDMDNTFLVGRLGDWTLDGFLTRMVGVIASYCLIAIVLSSCIGAASVLFVGLGLSEAVNWPPIMGPVTSAWSVRQFWRATWHQLLRRPLTSYSDFIAFSVLHLPRGTLLARYVRLFLVFGMSGLQHSAADMVNGIPAWPVMTAFLLQAAGIMFEDGVQAIYAWISPPPPHPPSSPAARGKASNDEAGRKRPRSLATVIIGYTWTLAFLGWSSAAWLFPGSRGLLYEFGLS